MLSAYPTRGLIRPTLPFRRDRLADPVKHCRGQGLHFVGNGIWKSAVRPFHNDTSPALRVPTETGDAWKGIPTHTEHLVAEAIAKNEHYRTVMRRAS